MIVKPHADWIDASEDYMLFLEKCCRTCYKSESFTKEGSAEKLLNKIVDSQHYSVLEHANAVVDFRDVSHSHLFAVYDAVDIFAGRTTRRPDGFILSGNMRMWKELLNNDDFKRHLLYWEAARVISQKWPFFFSGPGQRPHSMKIKASLLDENPVTNRNKLSVEDMKKHMSMTYRITLSRSGSHQLVRHRKCAFSQESQRYCDYGKKGFRYILPPEAEKIDTTMWNADVDAAYNAYLYWKHLGLKSEDARELLPNACATEVVTTSTLKNWIHVFDQRSRNKKAQWQIRQAIQEVEDHMRFTVPQIF